MSTGSVSVALAAAAVAGKSVVVDEVLVVAVEGARETAGLSKGWGDRDRAK